MTANRAYCSFWLWVALLGGCSSPEIVSQSPAPRIQTVELTAGDELLAGTNDTSNVVHDEVYGGPKRYRGQELGNFLLRRGLATNESGVDAVVQFICNDGYKPVVPLETLLRDSAFLATGVLDATNGQDWLPFVAGDAQRRPGPVYLVWPKLQKLNDQHPWPYGIVSLKISSPEALFGPASPSSAEHEKGFVLFQRNCMKCHSINGVGGSVGVDLNFPRNVFEYWRPAELRGFVHHPERFRLHTKMPSFEQLDDAQVLEILGYIRSMESHKIQLLE